MTIEIEKGVPLPMNLGSGNPGLYPWGQMEVGDSFFAPGAKQVSMRVRASEVGKRRGVKFVSRAVEGGVRVWRVA